MTGLAPLLDVLPRWTLVGGKGGVGKTTCAAALASASAARGTATLLFSTDPARSLGDAIGVELGAEPAPVRERPGLDAFQLDAARARAAFLAQWRDVLIAIVDRGTYLDVPDIAGLIDAALPGADEAMALLTLADIEAAGRWERIIVDTAPTGHTLRLLALPQTFRALIELLDLMQEKHRFLVSALTHRYRTDAADEFLAEMRDRLDRLAAVLRSPRASGLLLVARPEPVVVAETLRYLDALPALGLSAVGLVINAAEPNPDGAESVAQLVQAASTLHLRVVTVPRLDQEPMGLAGVDRWGAAAVIDGGPVPRDGPPEGPSRPRGAIAALPLGSPGVRGLTIVGGKGGVGKTTVACTLALLAARSDAPVLVVSTDPAPSVADALGQTVGDEETPVEGVRGLTARQMDATAAFDRVRQAYTTRIDAVFEGLVGGGLDLSYDRRILRELLALAPPGVDELHALASLGGTLAEARYAAVVVDPAPTGHLLRLLEMPAVALDWSHRLMRLILKYRELGALGEAAEDLLVFARQTRALGDLLRDSARAGLLVVSLDEPLVRAETLRLVAAARGLEVPLMGVFWNRVTRAPRPLPGPEAVRQFVGEAAHPPPRGVEQLRAWGATWRVLPETE
ncbi:MAG TPA: ArsA family ATPase [Gemmatimonadaceae bacterium]|nr:ArsA family ATPase [Gemmatimonadaceae bacterium]